MRNRSLAVMNIATTTTTTNTNTDGDDDDDDDDATSKERNIVIPTNRKLWSNLIHTVQQHLSSDGDSSSSSSSSCTNSTIYQLLKHGPALIHHFEDKSVSV
jgi:hypothetical protein